MSSQTSRHQSSVKTHGLRFLTQISSSSNSNPSTSNLQINDPSGPLTPDSVVYVNPFVATNNQSLLPNVRIIGQYELSETKLDDFKCARHIITNEIYLYKEYPLDILRQRLEPYQRLTKILLSTIKNKHLIKSMTIEQLAAKYHLHFFFDILSLEQTAIVLYPNYTNNLHTYITEKHRLNEYETKNLFTQIVHAVQMCHQVGLIIRDLKLRKIIFNNNEHSNLLLTGLDEAIMLTNPTTTNDFVSSRFSCPVYACPEIVLNRQMYSGKFADSWSLGIILYTMLFGRYPFCDRTLVGLFIKIGRCRPDIPRTISIKARSLLRSLIRVKPDERLLPQDILGHVWFNNTDRDISMNTSLINDESLLFNNTSSSNNNNCTNNSNESTIIEDAVVPNFECE
ncbi:unnamed protein product [Rotaria sp. Silwood1]|nr:unnamed protein product [Rotaria sp. Silwood1]CAF1564565.1 unnamed protein product [Rotaria sp. Silwood1]CAF3598634.1 unnamed protein product [Rotaria sp. Silwood1]CAF3640844.1 unnamed protein product [Rotaria sp. Silwood1]CAF3651969.1 unnamed protein product [Rotaria sp. Silwood1]